MKQKEHANTQHDFYVLLCILKCQKLIRPQKYGRLSPSQHPSGFTHSMPNVTSTSVYYFYVSRNTRNLLKRRNMSDRVISRANFSSIIFWPNQRELPRLLLLLLVFIIIYCLFYAMYGVMHFFNMLLFFSHFSGQFFYFLHNYQSFSSLTYIS